MNQDEDLCTCSHGGTHDDSKPFYEYPHDGIHTWAMHNSKKCTGVNSYGLPCECLSFELESPNER